jgi:hypothetical protein
VDRKLIGLQVFFNRTLREYLDSERPSQESDDMLLDRRLDAAQVRACTSRRAARPCVRWASA